MLDFQLRHIQETAAPAERVRVLIHFKNDLAELQKLEFQVSSVAGDVAAGSIPSSRMEELSKHPNIIFVEASRTLKDETDVSAVEINLVDLDTQAKHSRWWSKRDYRNHRLRFRPDSSGLPNRLHRTNTSPGRLGSECYRRESATWL
jgi:hypothetical protein